MRLAVCVIKPTLLALTKREWRGREHVPATGGVILAVNHISYVDPFVVAHFVYEAGRAPRFLAKASLFRLPLVGRVVSGAGQIPVHRYTDNASTALEDATAALRRGEAVVIYPEGTVTRDPRTWPMRARTGVARLALESGAPVVPVAQWGAQEVLSYGEKLPRLLPRKTMRFLAGPPVDVSGYARREPTARVLREVTDLTMARVRAQLGELRGEEPPDDVFDPRGLTPVDETRRSA
jgi:1-acyl-sn-glycerol-3-phosphate acyltransferase